MQCISICLSIAPFSRGGSGNAEGLPFAAGNRSQGAASRLQLAPPAEPASLNVPMRPLYRIQSSQMSRPAHGLPNQHQPLTSAASPCECQTCSTTLADAMVHKL